MAIADEIRDGRAFHDAVEPRGQSLAVQALGGSGKPNPPATGEGSQDGRPLAGRYVMGFIYHKHLRRLDIFQPPGQGLNRSDLNLPPLVYRPARGNDAIRNPKLVECCHRLAKEFTPVDAEDG